jgi:hypothetical protein
LSTGPRFAELKSFDYGTNALLFDIAYFFDPHYPRTTADERIHGFERRQRDRKPDFHSYTEPLVSREAETASRNIACEARDRLEFLKFGLELNLKGEFVATSCPTFLHLLAFIVFDALLGKRVGE